ncbi:hypothetical protein [Fulvivirga lutea]|uniref:Uncharacterized protein n=1 Tax=Fulvivirga lutea TaxID=2810512 RepID=A0A974ZZR4_9BACT|nr:hypothetical protein [Fulvivirga lutea]QSE96041.1 hypothetical protein JR347_10480 [Fulvivirga lutea]
MRKYLFALIAICSCINFTSCVLDEINQTVIYNGRTEIIEITYDETLQDSSVVFGKVISAVDNSTPEFNARIWTEKDVFETDSDLNGLFELKLPSGKYDIKCKNRYANSDFTEEIIDIELKPNEKLEVNFYLGVKAE